MKNMASVAIKIFFLVSSISFASIVCEFSVRAYYHYHLDYDFEMWRYGALLKKRTGDARGHVHRPGQSAKLMNVSVDINSSGFRDREFTEQKPPGVFRILALGDSMTFGWGVKSEQTFPKQIENLLNQSSRFGKVEVINAGVGNYNTEQELALYESDGIRFSPDLVLLGFYVNDAEPAQEADYGWGLMHSSLFALLRSRFLQMRLGRDPQFNYVNYYNEQFKGLSWERYKKTLNTLCDSVKKNGSSLAVVLIPDLRSSGPYPFREIHDQISKEFKKRNAIVIDLQGAFSIPAGFEKAFWVAPDDPHPNASADQLIAETVTQALIEWKAK